MAQPDSGPVAAAQDTAAERDTTAAELRRALLEKQEIEQQLQVSVCCLTAASVENSS